MFTTQTKTATITDVTTADGVITYHTNSGEGNNFAVGDIVHISGINPSNFNIPDAVVSTCTNIQFTVVSPETGSYVDGGLAVYDELKNHLITSSVIKTQTAAIAEWNMNIASNIEEVGNYRYRPTVSSPTEANFGVVRSTWLKETEASATKYYYGATYADVLVDGGVDDDETPIFYATDNQKQNLLFSLEDCLGKFRPRSGINKAVFRPESFIQIATPHMSKRPRYYFPSRDDKFKYWTSMRKDVSATDGTQIDRGVAINKTVDTVTANYIDDAAPFVVYTDPVAANRIVVKMQTNIGTHLETSLLSDPFYGDENKTTPINWKIQKLSGTDWTTLIEFDETSERSDGSAIIKEDGYVEIEYGLVIPDNIKDKFYHAGEYATASDLPVLSIDGYAYLVGASTSSSGDYYVWNDEKDGGPGYDDPFAAEYAWQVHEEGINRLTPFVTKMVDPDYFDDGTMTYREFDMLDGVRLVVSTMNKDRSSFDLIEMSPRLAVDLSDKLVNFSVKKYASDLGLSGLPVGQLLASSGTMNLFDYDQAFNPNYTFNPETGVGSIINGAITRNLKVSFYEITKDVNNSDYYIPIKTLYAEGFAQSDAKNRSVSVEMRDQFVQLESMIAQEIFFKDVSLSYAIASLLDSIGFSNYVFKRIDEEDPEIPFFFVPPNTSVAEILQSLAVSFQSTMFFDEYNNLVIMSKEYLMPSVDERDTDFVVYGSRDTTKSTNAGELYVKENSKKLSNIVEVASQISDIYNDGKIEYSARSIQRDMARLKEAYAVDAGRTWVYKPVLLWEAPNEPAKQSINEQNKMTTAYGLTAIPLDTDIPADPPTIADGVISNNTINLKDGAYWIPRYNGYLYANGEIIRFDAIEYSRTKDDGTIEDVWIRDVTEYKKYFAKIPFGGKLYPSGRVRIYTKVNEDGSAIAVHGRGQFGTDIVAHKAGIDPYWTNKDNVSGFVMQSQYLFNNNVDTVIPATESGNAGTGSSGANRTIAQKNTKVSGISKNVLITAIPDETDVNKKPQYRSYTGGDVKASALTITGPTSAALKTISSRDFVSYVHKKVDNKFTHFGTRLRIIGSADNKRDRAFQIIHNGSPYYTLKDSSGENVPIEGGGGGIAIMLDPNINGKANNGYFFEISALSYSGLGAEDSLLNNVHFYKVKKSAGSSAAIPVPLFKTNTVILADDGDFVGQGRAMAEKHPTVYDIAVEYVIISKTHLRFYLYLNNDLMAVVDDKEALPIKPNFALFARGGSKVMFENVYALGQNYAKNPTGNIDLPTVNPIFGNNSHTTNTLNKYALSGIIQNTMLSGVSPKNGPDYKIYYEEFGTIMREAAYFNVKYDKAYPALSAKLAPTVNTDRNYVVSGFTANAYGAEFLVFNATNTVLNLDASTGNYLRIIGVAFNEESKNVLTVDEYYNKLSDFSNPTFSGSDLRSADSLNKYIDIKNSRTTYGVKEFSIKAEYVQTQDVANDLMRWVIAKTSKPRKAVGLSVFGIPYVQLGDIVKVNYVDEDNVGQVSLSDSRYVVYTIEYSRNENGPTTVIYLSEVE